MPAGTIASLTRSFHEATHALFDGRGRLIVIEGILAAYRAILETGKLGPPHPAPHYARHLEWLAQQDMAPSRAFWQDAFQGISEANPLPLQSRWKHKPLGRDSHGVVRLALSANLSRKIERLQN